MHFAFALGPDRILLLVDLYVRYPVGDGDSSPEHYVDGLVRGQVAHESLGVEVVIVNHFCSDEALGSAIPSLGQIRILSAVSVSSKNNRDFSLS